MAETKKKKTAAKKTSRKSTSASKKRSNSKKSSGSTTRKTRNSGSNKRPSSRKNSGKGRSNNKAASSSKANTKAGTRAPVEVQDKGMKMGDDFQLIFSACIALLLFLSNFGLCGEAGKILSSFFFGLFGVVQYVMPVVFFFGVLILTINDYSILSMKKCFAAFVFLMMISAFVQICGPGTKVGIYDLFRLALENHVTGGVIGGGLACGLAQIFKTVGAVIILLCITLLSLIMLLQRSVVGFFKNIANRYRAWAIARKEAKAELAASSFMEDDMEEEKPVKPGTNTRKWKSIQEKEREKQVEKKVKQLEEKKKEAQTVKAARENGEEKATRKKKEFRVPTFSTAEDVKRKDSVKELHPEIYPFTQEDGKTTPFKKELDYTAFSFNSGKSPQEYAKDLAASMPAHARLGFGEELSGDGIEDFEDIPGDDGGNTYDFIERTGDNFLPEFQDDIVEDIPADDVEDIPMDEIPDECPGDENSEEEAIPFPVKSVDITRDVVIHKEEKKAEAPKENETAAKGFEIKSAEKDDYVFPPLSLLDEVRNDGSVDYDDQLKQTAQKLQDTLASFGVNVRITDISFGPTVTRYEMVPEQGTKVSKIVALSDDIKLNLAAEDIRIEAPIPGKSAIGIEVPNKDIMMVHFRELIDTPRFRNFKSRLAFAVGKDIGGQTVISDVAKMPHLLIAGATGSGKSVCINTLVMSILYKARPDEVKLIMVDPKMVELSIYNGIPHLLIPVVTDPKKASGALNWAVAEMTDRYNKFTTYGVRNIEGYNEKVRQVLASGQVDDSKLQKMPQIVVIIDELADLMMVAPGEVEDAIVRLTQLARAAGIHLVIATQRPSVNVITGLIKANVPSRIAFAVSSGVDSRTIIDMNGAEKLLGKGDMLFHPAGSSKPSRVQGAFISDEEIFAVVDFLKSNQQVAVYEEEIAEKINQKINNQESSQDRDEYFADAARFILEKDKASIGMLQRMFKIGFNRAARIMDQLADAGIVGPEEGTKPRKILMSPEQLEEYFEEYL